MDVRACGGIEGSNLAAGRGTQRLKGRLKLRKWLFAGPLAALAGCAPPGPALVPQVAGAPPLLAVAITALPGWESDNSAQALAAFVLGCKAMALMPGDQVLGGIGLSYQAAGQAGL